MQEARGNFALSNRAFVEQVGIVSVAHFVAGLRRLVAVKLELKHIFVSLRPK